MKETRGMEHFFTIFRMEAWVHMYARLIHESNPGGCGYDLCLHQACPDLRIAVDHRFVAIHRGDGLGRKGHKNNCVYKMQVEICGMEDVGWPGICMVDSPIGSLNIRNSSRVR